MEDFDEDEFDYWTARPRFMCLDHSRWNAVRPGSESAFRAARARHNARPRPLMM